ncbi:hypothetical protein Ccrd_025190 [Cynara cardunculus var. scolymus]|uniref:TIR domain-containing protein n=1 Tax=Cynara cardunculus var. scolymus TaxID=59895 RepID=A0A103XB89_CYNCS|nr:hypothetical protein Ccrd_025190 [Cynara cardunculus var. scolymus]
MAAYIWTVWTQRNHKTFRGTSKSDKDVCSDIQFTAYEWIRCRAKISKPFSWESWICNSMDAKVRNLVEEKGKIGEFEQRKNSNHFVLPVFYNVEPSDIRRHQKKFALQWYKKSAVWKEKGDLWNAALKEVATLPGFSRRGEPWRLEMVMVSSSPAISILLVPITCEISSVSSSPAISILLVSFSCIDENHSRLMLHRFSMNNEATDIKEIVGTLRNTLYPNSFSTPPRPIRQDNQTEKII